MVPAAVAQRELHPAASPAQPIRARRQAPSAPALHRLRSAIRQHRPNKNGPAPRGHFASLEESLYAERRPAATGALRIRILKLEACRLKRLYIIHRATAEIHQRRRINENLETVEGEDLVHHP